VWLLLLLFPPAGSVTAVEQTAKTFGLVLLTSDDDVARKSSPGAAVFGAAAADVEEGFDLAASEGTSSLLQASALCILGV
jgi:hypothetical protein